MYRSFLYQTRKTAVPGHMQIMLDLFRIVVGQHSVLCGCLENIQPIKFQNRPTWKTSDFKISEDEPMHFCVCRSSPPWPVMSWCTWSSRTTSSSPCSRCPLSSHLALTPSMERRSQVAALEARRIQFRSVKANPLLLLSPIQSNDHTHRHSRDPFTHHSNGDVA